MAPTLWYIEGEPKVGFIRNARLYGTRHRQPINTLVAEHIVAPKTIVADPTPAGGRKSRIIGGTKVQQTYKSLIGTHTFGVGVPTASIDPNRIYRIIGKHPMVEKYPLIEYVSFVSTDDIFGVRTHNVNLGTSTRGIEYKPPTTETPEEKRIRRWPREWHGENMN